MIGVERLTGACREELVYLWGDLDEARRDAHEGQWSMGCDSLVERIKALTSLVGATPWEQVQIPLVEDGVYQRVHRELGIEVAVDMDAVAEHRAWLDRQAVTS